MREHLPTASRTGIVRGSSRRAGCCRRGLARAARRLDQSQAPIPWRSTSPSDHSSSRSVAQFISDAVESRAVGHQQGLTTAWRIRCCAPRRAMRLPCPRTSGTERARRRRPDVAVDDGMDSPAAPAARAPALLFRGCNCSPDRSMQLALASIGRGEWCDSAVQDDAAAGPRCVGHPA